MPAYVDLVNWTEQGIKNFRDTGKQWLWMMANQRPLVASVPSHQIWSGPT